MAHHLAQINIGRLIAPIDDPKIAVFVAALDPINALADHAPGFIWRLQSASGNATDIAYNEDPTMFMNMSVWNSLEALRAYVYRSDHIRLLRDRAKWFEKLDRPIYCLWWIPAGHIPTVAEGPPMKRSASEIDCWKTAGNFHGRPFLLLCILVIAT